MAAREAIETNSDFVESERRQFIATNNAIHAWAAYSFARVVKAPPAEWVLRYFDLCARGVLQIASDAAAERGGKDAGPRIMRALRIKGSDLAGYHSKWMVHGMNVRRLILQGNKPDFAIDAVAKKAGVSYHTVRRAWLRFDKAFPGDVPGWATFRKSPPL